ncbi:MAG TPA: hypothetical protein VNV42_02430 [Solirubrobacteraceae bacterium]|jgi:hypothetical protein|nr:hypothetical protein [Solirubrobacteraceae bacterium]
MHPDPKGRAAPILLACLLCLLPAAAHAAPTVTLHAGLHPEHLGKGTTIKFAFSIAYSAKQPSPLTDMELRYPAHLGIATSGLGLSTCRAALLEASGPSGCPSSSLMGYGSGLAEVPFGGSLIHEAVHLTTFMAPLHAGHLGLLFYAIAPGPIAAEIILHGLVLPAPKPFGGDLATPIPLVPTMPGAPDAALAKFSTTLGPEHITYWEYNQGSYIPYHPRGIRLPRSCPHGGFQFAATFTFQNNTHATAHAAVPCPRSNAAGSARNHRVNRVVPAARRARHPSGRPANVPQQAASKPADPPTCWPNRVRRRAPCGRGELAQRCVCELRGALSTGAGR